MPSGEDRLIARYFKPLATAPGALALTDDAAFFAPPEGHDLVLTTDAIVSGVHFLPDDPPETVARKALRVNLSDLAAKGAHPAGCLLTLALPEGFGEAWLSPFASGLQSDCDLFACPLYGGDTVRTTGPLWLSVTAFGTLPRGTMVKRAGAKPGDRIVVTGTIGDARARSAAVARAGPDRDNGRSATTRRRISIGRYRVPQPRNAMADAVRAFASAAMDVSDGLAGDLAKAVRCVGRVGADRGGARCRCRRRRRRALDAAPGLIETIATGGDDYEILAAIPADKLAAFREQARAAAVSGHRDRRDRVRPRAARR